MTDIKLHQDGDEDRALIARSSIKHYADVLLLCQKDLAAAFALLSPEVKATLVASANEALDKLKVAVECAIIAGYRAGLVDFFEDAPS